MNLIDLLGSDHLVAAIQTWADDHPDPWLQLVGDAFDVDGQARATGASPKKVETARLTEQGLALKLAVSVTYQNPIDEDDRELSAENVEDSLFEFVLDAFAEHPLTIEELDTAPDGLFP